jgi:hypothetical protein
MRIKRRNKRNQRREDHEKKEKKEKKRDTWSSSTSEESSVCVKSEFQAEGVDVVSYSSNTVGEGNGVGVDAAVKMTSLCPTIIHVYVLIT